MSFNINTDLIMNYIEANHWTKKEFCKQCNIGISTFYKVMRGENVKITALMKIARTIKVKLYFMFRKS